MPEIEFNRIVLAYSPSPHKFVLTEFGTLTYFRREKRLQKY